MLRKISKFGWPHPCISPQDFGCSRVEKRVFSSATIIEPLLQLSSVTDGLVVGCYGLVVSFTYPNHLEKFVEKLYIFFVVSFSKSRKRKKENTMNINSKREKKPGKEIKHLLFFIVGKVAILSTFFDWRKSMYSEV